MYAGAMRIADVPIQIPMTTLPSGSGRSKYLKPSPILPGTAATICRESETSQKHQVNPNISFIAIILFPAMRM